MAIINPVVSNSQALITPGWPLASVENGNPVSTVVAKEASTIHRGTAASTTHELARVQSGHSNDRAI